MTTNYEVIDQFFAAQVACNESEQHSLGHAYACIFFAKNKQNKYKLYQRSSDLFMERKTF